MNRYTIIGNLVRDPETGTTESGVNWCQFTVAARRRYHKEGEPDAEFVRVTVWRRLAESCATWLTKGKMVYCSGEPRAYAWLGRSGGARGQIDLTATEVEFLSSGQGKGKPTDGDVPGEYGGGDFAGDMDGAAAYAESEPVAGQPDDRPY
jgi:single-strand DNA-binding protein